MNRISKSFTVFIILIMAISSLSLIMIKPTLAQSISKPSTPDFTIKYVDRSYDTQPTYGLDQYTGKTVITKPSEHVDNRTIEITIKNQPFTPFTDSSSGREINLYYNVRYKGSFGQDWTLLFGKRVELYDGTLTDPLFNDGYPSQDSSSQYSIISYTLPWNIVRGQIDVQVEALKGYVNRTLDSALSHLFYPVYNYTLFGEESEWTTTQTITIGETSASTSTNPTQSPTNITSPTSTVPEFSWFAILPLFVATLFIAIKLRHHKMPRY